MEETELQLQMRARIRRHMLTVIGGVFVGFFGMAVVGGVVRGVTDGGNPGVMGIFPILGILLIPVIGFWSTFKNLRCPACDGLVAYQVSWKYSLFGNLASDECRHCGKTIFSPSIPARFRKMMLIMMAVGFGLAFLGAAASVALRPHP